MDYGARWYDGSVGRFTGVDPISDEFPWVTVYNYAENGPIVNIDLWGLQAINSNGALYYSVKLYGQKGFDDYMTAQKASVAAYSVISPVDEISVGVGVASKTPGIGPLLTKASQATSKLVDETWSGLKGLIGSGNGVFKSGKWTEVSENMSEAAASFQKQVTGVDVDKSFKLNDVKFDGVTENGILLDAKSGMENFIGKDGGFHKWFEGSDGLLDQANRQLRASEGAPIQWHFENRSVMEATHNLFKKNDVQGIELIHTPRQ